MFGTRPSLSRSTVRLQAYGNAAPRPVSYKWLVKVFEREGFSLSRQHGDHRIYTKPGIKRPLVIPAYDDVPIFIIRISCVPLR